MALEAAVCSSWEVGSLSACSVPDLNPACKRDGLFPELTRCFSPRPRSADGPEMRDEQQESGRFLSDRLSLLFFIKHPGAAVVASSKWG